jgi:hypothetical protein
MPSYRQTWDAGYAAAKKDACEAVVALRPAYESTPTSDGDRLAGYVEAIADALAAIRALGLAKCETCGGTGKAGA